MSRELEGLLLHRFKLIRMINTNQKLLKMAMTEELRIYYREKVHLLTTNYYNCMIRIKYEYDNREERNPHWRPNAPLERELIAIMSMQQKQTVATEPTLPDI